MVDRRSYRGLIYAAVVLVMGGPVFAQQVVYQQIPANSPVTVVGQQLDFPCWYCLAVDSQGGGRSGATASIMDLHVISSKDDVAFPRALVARIESACAGCQPAALTAQARGSNPMGTVFGANIEAYGVGRASVIELNMGAAGGGYGIDFVPVRLPDGSPSRIDSILKVEGQNSDPGAAQIGSYIDARINPAQALIVLPADQGPVTVMATADGRMKEVWGKDAAGKWSRQVVIDGVVQP